MKKEDKEKLKKLMLKQFSAIRTAYNMLRDLEKEKTKNPYAQIYQRLRNLFPDLLTIYIDSNIYKCLASLEGSLAHIGGRSVPMRDFFKTASVIPTPPSLYLPKTLRIPRFPSRPPQRTTWVPNPKPFWPLYYPLLG